MSYRLSQLSPQASTGETTTRIAVKGSWSAPPERFRDVQFWRSWMELDSEVDESHRSRVNRDAILGLALVVGISASFWTGVGLLVARIWR